MENFEKADSIWESKEKEILDGLDKKIEIVMSLKKLIDSITIEMPHEQVREALKKFFHEVQTSYSTETIDLFNKYLLLAIDIDAASMASAEKDSDNTAIEATEKIRAQRDEILENPDVYFISQIHSTLNQLMGKNSYIKKGDKKIFVKDLMKKTEYCTPEDIEEIIIDPFCVSFEINSDIWKKHPQSVGTLGMYIPSSPFILFDSALTEDRRKEILDHEKIHNLIEEADSITYHDYAKETKRRFSTYDKLLKLNAPDILLDSAKKQIFDLQANIILDSLHNEIIANHDSAKKRDFGFKHLAQGPDMLLSLAKNNSTAGYQMIEIQKTLNYEIKNNKDKEIVEHCKKLQKDLKKGGLEILSQMSDSVDMAKSIGPEAELQVDTLFAILKPTKYRHADTYLKYKYGKKAD